MSSTADEPRADALTPDQATAWAERNAECAVCGGLLRHHLTRDGMCPSYDRIRELQAATARQAAETAALRDALRERVIEDEPHYAQATCGLCFEVNGDGETAQGGWKPGTPERHAAGCLAATPPPEPEAEP